MQGYDTTAHALACFGGAGGQHACAIARALGMKEIFVHRYVDEVSRWWGFYVDVGGLGFAVMGVLCRFRCISP